MKDKTTVRLGVVGAGGVLALYAPALPFLKQVRLQAVADPDPARRDRAQRQHGIPEAYATAEAMLDASALDGLIIASPPFLHLEHVRLAAAAGKHILLEKPMARTVREGRAMIEVCRRRRVILAGAFNRRFCPPLWTATDMVRSGELGEVFHVDVIWSGFSSHQPNGWRDSGDCMGGMYQDHGAHTLDLCRQWLGPVERVSANGHCIGPRVGVDRGVEDHLNALFSHRGGRTSVHVHSRDSQRPVSEFYRLYGTRGTLEIEFTGDWSMFSERPWDLRLYRQGAPHPEIPVTRRPADDPQPALAESAYSYYREIALFGEAIRTGRLGDLAGGEDALSTVRAICASYRSAALGRTVSLRDPTDLTIRAYNAFIARLKQPRLS